jgi:DNA replication and repair protein RecF
LFVKSINTINLRNLKDGSYTFEKDGINLILGNNGSGKTTILEAVYFLNYGESFRSFKKLNLVKLDKEYAQINGLITINNSDICISALIKNICQYTVNNKNVSSLTNTNTAKDELRSLIFTPENIQTITGTPSLRRELFDTYIGLTNNKYLYALSSYNKVLKQKNALLKSANEDIDKSKYSTLEVWNLKLMEFGNSLIKYRQDYINSINPAIKKYYSEISNEEGKLKVFYNPNVSEITKKEIETNLKKELYLQTSLFGPHRDEYDIYLTSRQSRYQLSRGEQRTASFSILLSCYEQIKQLLDIKPILLLDDIASELDFKRVERLFKVLPDGQTIITTTDGVNSENISNTLYL